MSLSIPKCKTLNISRKKPPSNREYHPEIGPYLPQLAKKKNLGITITDNLQWSQHRDINQISLRANRIPDIICSPGRDISDTDIRTLLYCSIAQPKLGKLEYASELWSPYTCTFARKCSAHSYGVYFKLSERHVLQGSVSQT